MPSFTVTSLLTYLGIFVLLAGAFLIIAGLGIVNIQNITVTQGQKTLIAGIIFLALGISLLLPEIYVTLTQTTDSVADLQAFTETTTLSNNTSIDTAAPTVDPDVQTIESDASTSISATPTIYTSVLPPTATTAPPTATTAPPTATLVPTETPLIEPGRPRGTIIYSIKYEDSIYGLTGINLNTGTKYTIPNYVPNKDFQSAWSTDGRYVAFVSFRDDPNDVISHIYIMRTDGSELRRLTEIDQYEAAPSWSRDSRRLAFYAEGDGDDRTKDSEIYIIDMITQEITQLTNNSYNDRDPTWSPDGTQIAFYSDRDHLDGRHELYTMDLNTNIETRITFDGADNYTPVWAPTGNRIAYVSGTDDNAEIFVIDLQGELPLTKLTDNGTRDWFPAWSPDGNYITFSSGSRRSHSIYIVKSDGREQPIRITNEPIDEWFSFWIP